MWTNLVKLLTTNLTILKQYLGHTILFLKLLGVALGAIYSLEDAEVLSLLAIAQRLVARWPD